MEIPGDTPAARAQCGAFFLDVVSATTRLDQSKNPLVTL